MKQAASESFGVFTSIFSIQSKSGLQCIQVEKMLEKHYVDLELEIKQNGCDPALLYRNSSVEF